MRPLTRVSLLLGLLATCCALIYAAGLIGRGLPAIIVAGRDRNSAVSPMDVLLIDYSRGLSIQRRITMPFAIRANWEAHPPQVLMRAVDGDAVTFSLSQLDLSRLRLEPLMTYRVPSDPRPRDLELSFSGRRAAVYSPATGEVSLVEDGTLTRQVVNAAENSNDMVMAWSADGERLAVKDYRSAQLALLDGTSIRLINTFRDAAPVWLPDSRSILLAQDTFVRRNGRILLLDAVTGEALPYTEGLVGRTAALCGPSMLGYGYVLPTSAQLVRMLDLSTGETTTVLEAGWAEQQDITGLAFAPRDACDWLLLEMRHPDDLDTRLYRLHIPTGDLTFLGDNARLLEVTADAVIYESITARVALTVRRAAFDVGAEPEIFGRIPTQNEAILWLDGYRRGLFLRSGQLWMLDLATGTKPLLTVPARMQDLQLVAGE